jgi:hypothetical protein
MLLLRLTLGISRCLGLYAVLVLCGIGLHRLFRVPASPSATVLLAPAATQAFWACTLAVCVVLGYPVSRAALVAWPLTIGLAAYGALTLRQRGRHFGAFVVGRRARCLLAAAMTVPLVVLLPNFVYGLTDYLGSGSLDGWSYVAYGQYLWEYPRGTEGGLAPLYQWASHLSSTRHVTSAELGLLSVVIAPGEVYTALGLFCVGAIFVIAATLAACAEAWELPFAGAVLFVVLGSVSGWTLNMIRATNFDNLLATIYLPASIALVNQRRPLSIGEDALLGMFTAGALYTYPELSGLLLVCLALVFMERAFRDGVRVARREAFVAAACCALIVAPNASELVNFAQHQIAAGLQPGATRPGGNFFVGLLEPGLRLSAFWGLGGEDLAESGRFVRTASAAGLSLLAAAGLVQLLRRRALALAGIVLIFLLAIGIMLVRERYTYGAYKLITLGWWSVTLTVILGLIWLSTLRRLAMPLVTCGAIVAGAIPLVALGRSLHTVMHPGVGLEQFRVVADGVRLIGQQPIAVLLDDLLARHWAVYFLRHASIRVNPGNGYLGMPHVQALLSRATQPAWHDTRYVLRDAVEQDPFDEHKGWSLVWGAGTYSLWDTRSSGGWVVPTATRIPNGIERDAGKPFFWIGSDALEVTIVAQRPGRVAFSGLFVLGPHLPRTATVSRVAIAANGQPGGLATVPSGGQTLDFAIAEGENVVTLTVTDPPQLSHASTGDPRTMLLGVGRPRLELR